MFPFQKFLSGFWGGENVKFWPTFSVFGFLLNFKFPLFHSFIILQLIYDLKQFILSWKLLIFFLNLCLLILLMKVLILKKKRFNNRETSRASFFVIRQMSFKSLFPSLQLKLTPFLIQRTSTNHDKGQCFYPIVKSLYPLMFLQCRISFVSMK